MARQLTVSGKTPVRVKQDRDYTHVMMTELSFVFPKPGRPEAGAIIKYAVGNTAPDGTFVPISEFAEQVPDAQTRAFLTRSDTRNKMEFFKLEEAMLNYLESLGKVTEGTEVVIPE